MESVPAGQVVIKEGYAKKRNGRMQQWTHRYFVLTTSMISYKIKQDSPTTRCTFDLSPGCMVTEIVAERGVAGKKLFSFWIVWPHEKRGERDKKDDRQQDSDDENVKSDDESKPKVKDLAQIVQQEARSHRKQKDAVNQQIELHQAHDNNVSIGAKVAAVAVGGVVVGALTAGIGLIPYLTVVGITAAASGGAVAFTFRRPMDSRLIIACETMAEAIEWRTAIEKQIAQLSELQRPALPASVDPTTISAILDPTQLGGTWKAVRIHDCMRILEHTLSDPSSSSSSSPSSSSAASTAMIPSSLMANDSRVSPLLCATSTWMGKLAEKSERGKPSSVSRCRRAQLAVQATPTDTFLALMNSRTWPKAGSFQVVKEVDDHADFIGVELPFPSTNTSRRLCFSRFWHLDDDGVYLITYNGAVCVEFPHAEKSNRKKCTDFVLVPHDSMPSIAAVITVTPRQDVDQYDYDVPEALITCSCQITNSKGTWTASEVTHFMDTFLTDHLLEVRFALMAHRYDMQYQQQVLQDLPPHSTPSTSLIPAPSVAVMTPVSALRKTKSSAAVLGAHAAAATAATTAATTSTGSGGAGGVGSAGGSFPTAPPPSSEPSTAAARLVRRGVTTVQPGMEDVGEDHLTPEKRPNRLMRMFTSRKNPKPSDELGGHVMERTPSTSHASSEASDISRQRSSRRLSNSEATRLRREIAAAEYELQRLNKALRKRGGGSGGGGGPPSPGDSSPSSRARNSSSNDLKEINDKIHSLQTKVRVLKQEYLSLMGESYEQRGALGRTTLDRLRHWRKRADEEEDILTGGVAARLDRGGEASIASAGIATTTAALATTTDGSSSSSSLSAGRCLPRPRHWLPADYGLSVEEKKKTRATWWKDACEVLSSSLFYRQVVDLSSCKRFTLPLLVNQTNQALFPMANAVVLVAILVLWTLISALNGLLTAFC